MGDGRDPPLPPAILSGEDWRLQVYEKDHMMACFNKSITHIMGVWKAENALLATLPTFFTQLSIIITFTYLLKRLLKPLCLPRFVADVLVEGVGFIFKQIIILGFLTSIAFQARIYSSNTLLGILMWYQVTLPGGVIMGPSILGFQNFALEYIVPFRSIMTLETIANYSLIYYMFLRGLEVDFKPIFHARNKVLSIAIASIVIPAPIGYGLHKLLLREAKSTDLHSKPSVYGPLFWGITLATTNFTELAQLLANGKLIHSDIGRTALSITVITDFISWFLLVIAMAAVNDSHLYTMSSTLAFVILCAFVLRPALSWMVHHTCIDDNYNEHHIGIALAGALLFGYITDSCGSHSIVGAFMLGVILPKGELKNAIMEKVDYFVSDVMLPLFFVVIGLRTEVHHIKAGISLVLVLAIIVSAILAKVVVTFVAALINQMPLRDSFALGLLMNTKGVLALIILNSGRDLKVLDNQTFTIMVFSVLVMTAIVGPFMTLLYKSSGPSKQIQCKSIRSIQESNSEFRILICVHKSQNVTGVVNLLEASNPTTESPISVFAVHLVELTSSHASAMLIVHDTCKSTAGGSRGGSGNQKQSHITSAFENFESENDGTTVQALTAISAYTSMHEDICSLAGEKDITLIIVPFHKQSSLDGGMEDANSYVGVVNQNVFDNAPCTVAVFVDRGLNSIFTESSSTNSGNDRCHRFAMLFTGGPDDREALAYALRMAQNPNVNLTVVKFIAGQDATFDLPDEDENGILKVMAENERQKKLDDQYIESFLINTRNQPWINLTKEVVNNGEETIQLISSMGNEYDLYIVGRGQSVFSPLTLGLSDWGDCPELGTMGDTLVSSSFMTNASILVVQKGSNTDNEAVDFSQHSIIDEEPIVNRKSRDEGDRSDP